MTVSNEDRKAVVAINELAAAADILSNTTCHHWLNHDIACDPCRIDALIAHGWGPRAKLPSGKINNWLEVAVYAIDNADSEIRADLAAVGIEVTE